jgi:hypothetical protein
MTSVETLHASVFAEDRQPSFYLAAGLFLPSTGKNPISKSSMFTMARTTIIFTPSTQLIG